MQAHVRGNCKSLWSSFEISDGAVLPLSKASFKPFFDFLFYICLESSFLVMPHQLFNCASGCLFLQMYCCERKAGAIHFPPFDYHLLLEADKRAAGKALWVDANRFLSPLQSNLQDGERALIFKTFQLSTARRLSCEHTCNTTEPSWFNDSLLNTPSLAFY